MEDEQVGMPAYYYNICQWSLHGRTVWRAFWKFTRIHTVWLSACH